MENIKLMKRYEKGYNALLKNRYAICVYGFIENGAKYYLWDAWGGLSEGIADLKDITPR